MPHFLAMPTFVFLPFQLDQLRQSVNSQITPGQATALAARQSKIRGTRAEAGS